MLLLPQDWDNLPETPDSAGVCGGVSTNHRSEAAKLRVFKWADADPWMSRELRAAAGLVEWLRSAAGVCMCA